MRSFRAEALSTFVQLVIDSKPEEARATFLQIKASYPIYVTRDLKTARAWLRGKARGTERYGLVASSKALRLKAEGIHVRSEIVRREWFLNASTDVRSSYYLEDVATEFAVQGLELDWAGVCWDADFQYGRNHWVCRAFKGTKWQLMADEGRQRFLKNAYRVLLTRARQGMILFVPNGDLNDPTRLPALYGGTFRYLCACGIEVL